MPANIQVVKKTTIRIGANSNSAFFSFGEMVIMVLR
ncbi:hypothetical protein M2103_000610 [Ereboglobus sp. PH5-5]|nr:hypothetical protein [Ereboglobus sp. PH5-5]